MIYIYVISHWNFCQNCRICFWFFLEKFLKSWVCSGYCHSEHIMCCNLAVAESVRSREHWLWDTARKRNVFLLFSIVLGIFQLLYNFGTTGPIQVRFSATCTSPDEDFKSNRTLKMSHVWLPTDFPRSHHIFSSYSVQFM